MDKISLELLKQIADIEKIPQGAYNFRIDGKKAEQHSTSEIQIVSKKDKQGIDIYVAPNTKGKSVHIPVMLTKGGLKDMVYNDFHIGENCDIVIVAGCGIYNCSNATSEHQGIHTFYIGKNSHVKYVEKHLGIGENNSKREFFPITKVYMQQSSTMEMETTQIGGVSNTNRKSFAKLYDNAKLIIKEKIMTDNDDVSKSSFEVQLVGKKSSVDVLSRSVAKGKSKQTFTSNIIGKSECFGHVECDGIILDNGIIVSTPKINAQNIDSTLVHEAAIGKIAQDQITKLETLGLNKEDAEKIIIESFML